MRWCGSEGTRMSFTRPHHPTTSLPHMTSDQVAAALEEIAVLMELRGENPFKSNAYHNAARTIEQMSEDLVQVVSAGRLDEIRGIGSTLRTVITALVRDGRAPLLEELRAQIPPGLVQMLRLPGLGPKKIIGAVAKPASAISTPLSWRARPAPSPN